MEISFNIGEIDSVASEVLTNAHSNNFLFYGPMGVGKTTLIKAIADQLGVSDYVSSPTFSLVNEYNSSKGKVCHYDFYRIKSIDEVLDLGLDEYLESDYYNLVEWPEMIVGLIPQSYVEIKLSKGINEERIAHIKHIK
ncbi:tRNA (adenosine(37)-N6)-threonylcarbamoyltransferase complex ATPase subunit type 1 TsaE [Flavobacteriaceae bacterium]|nr:tRNA (adenosine(37)-N6)-threonylcarbamoyltransferase complex ATPase subunit type 1 TsaE [Flavobacteriaceae bacterium]